MAWISTDRLFTVEENMQNNAEEVFFYLWFADFSLNAIAGILGNMEVESTINPGVWQYGMTGNLNVGFGLVQWTPASNYTKWADANGYEWGDGNGQCHWIAHETVKQGQWINTTDYPISFAQFKKSKESPEYLASCFLKNFERAGVEVEDERRANARKWYTYLNNLYDIEPEPEPEPEPEQPTYTSFKKSHYKFFLFNRQRRTRR